MIPPVLIDTSFFFAGIVPMDAHHQRAAALNDRIAQRELLTTNHVRGEAWTLLRRRESHAKAAEFIEGLEHSRIQVVHLDTEIEHEALAWLRQHDEREYSFVDATSFAFMRRHGITEALAFDGDFAAAGFVELQP